MRLKLAAILALVLVAVAPYVASKAGAGSEKTWEYYQSIYPCTKCHATMNLTGNVKSSAFHNIDLTKDAHRGLYCSNCHTPPEMINLRGGAKVYIPGFHNHSLVMETNKLCATCHPQEYNDYLSLIHGNKTYTCPGGSIEKIVGYKGVVYPFHVCPNGYKNLTTIPAKACVECHDPHTPTFKPLNILPEPSERPPPPDETPVTVANIVAILAALIPIALAFIARFSRER